MGVDAEASGSYLTSTRGNRVVLCRSKSSTVHNEVPADLEVKSLIEEDVTHKSPSSKRPKPKPGLRSTSNVAIIGPMGPPDV